MEYPELYAACELRSSISQKRFLRSRAVELTLLVLAAAMGEIPNSAFHNLGPIIAFFLFLLALILRISGVGARSEKEWYDARAACESIKSVTWLFAAVLEPYDTSDIDAQAELHSVLNKILRTLDNLDVPSNSDQSAAATTEMKSVRALPPVERARRYQTLRLDDQISWYRGKATWNKKMAKLSLGILITIESSAVILGFLRVLAEYNVNWLGILAVAAAAIAAWQQTKNYSSLSESYAVTSHELSLVAASLEESIGTDSWATAAKDAESAFSREHTLWLARRAARTPTTE